MSKLLNNLPVEDLTPENDYLGILDKGEIIKTFLENNTTEFKDIKMFSLYGEWGSGKSTLMKYLERELKTSFNTFFFEAWQYESDDNLSLSLLEFLSYKTADSTEEGLGNIVEVATRLFRGFSKSLRITVPGLSIDGNKIVESLEEKPEETFYQLKKQFETEFIRWEDNITNRKQPKYSIVFIDDLDRCEPENVLNLLSALKLFFSYGEKTIFFCGIDKKAVKEAVKTKYREVVKANEYLEKIFDVSFNMPEHDNLLKLVSQYFDARDIKVLEDKLNNSISSFFEILRFTNPRRVKKVLNKFLLLKNIKENDSKFNQSTSDFYTKNEGNFFETILTLYVIILHDFYSNIFDKLFDFKYKEVLLLKIIKQDSTSTTNYNQYRATIEHLINKDMINMGLNVIPFSQNEFQNLIFIFLPNNIKEIGMNSYSLQSYNTFKFSEENIEYRFLNYLLSRPGIFSDQNKLSNITLIQIKKMIKKIL